MSKLKKRLWMGTCVVVGLAVVVGVAYAWTHSGYVTIEEGISIGVDADPGVKTIQFEESGIYDPGYIRFSSADDNYIEGYQFGTVEFITLHADYLTMESEDGGGSVVVDYDGDVIITLGD